VQQQQLAPRLSLYGTKPGNILVRKQTRRGSVLEGPDHLPSLSQTFIPSSGIPQAE
jgi:hypothetical protein